MRFFTHKAESKGIVTIEISPEGISIAYSRTENPRDILICEFHSTQNYSQVHEVLATAVAKNNLAQNDCALVLHPDHYKLFFINTPSVPESEVRNAARWQIKDMITYSLDDLAIDVFYPEEETTHAKKIYVIAAQKSLLQKITKIVSDCQLAPISIDVREFAVRNVIRASTGVPEVAGFLDLSMDNCLMVTVQNGIIRFVRRIPVGIRAFKETNSVASLTAEIQRSIHYCETELKQKLPETFFLPPSIEIDPKVVESIANNLAKPTTTIDLNKIITATQPIPIETQVRCWATIGELLKKEDKKG